MGSGTSLGWPVSLEGSSLYVPHPWMVPLDLRHALPKTKTGLLGHFLVRSGSWLASFLAV